MKPYNSELYIFILEKILIIYLLGFFRYIRGFNQFLNINNMDIKQAFNIELHQNSKLPEKDQIDAIDTWLMVFSSTLKKPNIPYQELFINRIKQNTVVPTPVMLNLPNSCMSNASFVILERTIESFQLLTLMRKLVKTQAVKNSKKLGIVVSGFDNKTTERVAEALISAVLSCVAIMPSFKSTKQNKNKLKNLLLYGICARHQFKESFAIAEGNAITRRLTILPPNNLDPKKYLKIIKGLAYENNWKIDFYDESFLKNKKAAGAFLAVAQGSSGADAGIVRLRYIPKLSNKEKIFLVGKGICYDTGGVNIKPAKYMFGMHEDMQGSAVALGVLLALTKLNFNKSVECWIPLATNDISSKSYKPNDVVTASDGTTIEVVHTDAEGRMVLSDTLALVSKNNPSLIIDYATLTGACMSAIGTSYSGIFTNRKKWHTSLINAGQDSGERVWPFPLDEDFDLMLESEIADIKQCSLENGVDHILAARFLQHFIKDDIPWIHMDLSASNKKGGLAHIPTDTTGFGVRYTVNLLMNNYLTKT